METKLNSKGNGLAYVIDNIPIVLNVLALCSSAYVFNVGFIEGIVAVVVTAGITSIIKPKYYKLGNASVVACDILYTLDKKKYDTSIKSTVDTHGNISNATLTIKTVNKYGEYDTIDKVCDTMEEAILIRDNFVSSRELVIQEEFEK